VDERGEREMNEKEGFVKLKMPTYYIAKHSDEDLRDAVLKEREACAKLCDDAGYAHEVMQGSELAFDLAKAIRGRTE
jgi:hypothetical protein